MKVPLIFLLFGVPLHAERLGGPYSLKLESTSTTHSTVIASENIYLGRSGVGPSYGMIEDTSQTYSAWSAVSPQRHLLLEIQTDPHTNPLPEGAQTDTTFRLITDLIPEIIIPNSDVTYTPSSSWISSTGAPGIFAASNVYQEETVNLQGTWGNYSHSAPIVIQNHLSDNFGTYAGDGLGDDWQVQHYGVDNADAAPTAQPRGAKRPNFLSYFAQLPPTETTEILQVVPSTSLLQYQYRRLKSTISPQLTALIEVSNDLENWIKHGEDGVTITESNVQSLNTTTELVTIQVNGLDTQKAAFCRLGVQAPPNP